MYIPDPDNCRASSPCEMLQPHPKWRHRHLRWWTGFDIPPLLPWWQEAAMLFTICLSWVYMFPWHISVNMWDTSEAGNRRAKADWPNMWCGQQHGGSQEWCSSLNGERQSRPSCHPLPGPLVRVSSQRCHRRKKQLYERAFIISTRRANPCEKDRNEPSSLLCDSWYAS